jgi:hypothetical protein
MAGAAEEKEEQEEQEEARKLAKKIREEPLLSQFNDGYLDIRGAGYSSGRRASNDPVYMKNYTSDIKGHGLYNLFKAGEGEYMNFYTEYFKSTPLDKYYFFYEILQAENEIIHNPLYERIKSEIRKQLFEHPNSDLSQMLSSVQHIAGVRPTPLEKALLFLSRIPTPIGMEMRGQLVFKPKPRPTTTGQGGKRHSRIKRKSKKSKKFKSKSKRNKMQKKKSHRRRHI